MIQTRFAAGEEKKRGSLLEDLEPPVNPPKTIPDPNDEKPSDWEDEAKVKCLCAVS